MYKNIDKKREITVTIIPTSSALDEKKRRKDSFELICLKIFSVFLLSFSLFALFFVSDII